MDNKIGLYLSDYFSLLMEKAEEAKEQHSKEQSEYSSGRLMALHEVLSLAQQQAEAFQISPSELGLPEADLDKLLLG